MRAYLADANCAAWKVLYYARAYSGNPNVYRAINLESVKNGWHNSIDRMTLLLLTCDKCSNAECENLAKLVAHAWLKAYNIPDKSGVVTPPPPKPGSCAKSNVTEAQAAGLILLRAEDKCLIGRGTNVNWGALIPFSNWSGLNITGSAKDREGLLNAQCYQSSIKTIVAAKARGDCTTVEKYVELAGAAFANQSKCNLYQANAGCAGGGSIKTTPTPKTTTPRPTGTDSDCFHWGGDWLGGALDGFCTAGKKLTKGAEAGVQNPLTQYLPIMLIGMGFLAILMLAKK